MGKRYGVMGRRYGVMGRGRKLDLCIFRVKKNLISGIYLALRLVYYGVVRVRRLY